MSDCHHFYRLSARSIGVLVANGIELVCNQPRCARQLRNGDFVVSVKTHASRRLYCQNCWSGMRI